METVFNTEHFIFIVSLKRKVQMSHENTRDNFVFVWCWDCTSAKSCQQNYYNIYSHCMFAYI